MPEFKLEKSESIKELATALSKFQGIVKSVGKDGKNPFFKSKYSTLDNMIATTQEPLSKQGLAVSQFPVGSNGLLTILMHSSGEYIALTATMTPKDSTPQAQGSAITYMRRYAFAAVLRIAADEDDDGNAASKKAEHYDESPIPEDVVPVVSYDDHENVPATPKPTNTGTLAGNNAAPWKKPAKEESILSLKNRIKKLVDDVVMVELEGNKEYVDWVGQATGLDLTVQTKTNLLAIIERLQAMP